MDYKFTFQDGSESLMHYGVKGMKWGVWNSETATRYGRKGGVLPKGSYVSRIATSPQDSTYFNKKHVSTTRRDHDKWVEYLGPRNRDIGVNTYDVVYSTAEDLKIASSKELGKIYVNSIIKDSRYAERAKIDIADVNRVLNGSVKTTKMSDLASGQIAAQTKTGKQLVDNLLSQGYGGIADTHGQNVAKDPIIILNPDKNLIKDSVYYGKYWSPNGVDSNPKEIKTYTD